ncbi:MAG: hypothetical protein HYS27_13030 [Deltaproteobacteria bacterium]|nr:hypothetical protein [Deltaproteobacteria bacterium]
MSKQSKTARVEQTPTATPAAAVEPTAEPAPAATAPVEAAAGAPAARAPARLLAFVQRRVKGTAAERIAKRATDVSAKVPALAERELDAALDRLGLVRKSKAGQGGTPAAVVTVSAIKPA